MGLEPITPAWKANRLPLTYTCRCGGGGKRKQEKNHVYQKIREYSWHKKVSQIEIETGSGVSNLIMQKKKEQVKGVKKKQSKKRDREDVKKLEKSKGREKRRKRLR